ncbi:MULTISPECIES: PTS transporter subunit EIIC [Bacillus]|uniref:PTS acetylglucosamine transporter subunit IIB n=1 Tax=Bacillus glycinifermentans TaxID=1664069 RepID=A0AAJ3YVG9_9BACI|nr:MULTISPECIES: PTS transporter subunit EIIC [Bacillus]KKB75497.1 PTS acetylglucosamine transporter subunit IIB [Bacillus sp. TH008]MDU0071187.1 PTS transporter subunit EIIC [Bacillus sp. IG6]MED8019055.1 PTS transporter subunit EIIC [Bacillus glycinifermentans]QAT63756.1 PTS acetylglucosamine transporter subunit IIB [Bacillus glycinifermentans]WKB77629.1 PTS transporter subunit EIIC [Bacillus glycinifermentans]
MKHFLQKLGKSMLIPIAALPAAGLLLRLSAEDMLDIPLFQASGVILNNMDILIAIGIAMGLANTKDKGIPALTGFLAVSVLQEGLGILNQNLDMSVFGGVVAGLVAAFIYNRFHQTRLPSMFAFFGGEKFPITMIILVMIPIAGLFSVVWPYAQAGIDAFSQMLVGLGAFGIFVFGFFNRFLLPFGLHHVMNTYVYFGLGRFETASGETVTGEITRFLNGDPAAGYFLGGFYVTMMFGIPAIALAITRAARTKKKETKALMSSGAATSLITGITEPIEFTFLFTSPLLYFLHSVYTGLAGMVLYLLGIRHGFSWGAGAIDYVLNLNLSDRGLLLIPVGLAFFVLYYVTFYLVITKRNVPVIGREQDAEAPAKSEPGTKHSGYETIAANILQHIGGRENVIACDNCMTRLRMKLTDTSLAEETKLKQSGAHGVIKIGRHDIQIVIGPGAANVKRELENIIERES